MFFRKLFGRSRHKATAGRLYQHLVGQARRPAFYTDYGVADTVDGRFDLLALHVALAMRRLKRVEPAHASAAKDLTQALVDLMFADMDVNLRETGVSDISVGRKVRKLAESFYGRLSVYEAALAMGDPSARIEGLSAALTRNLYRSVAHHPSADRMAYYALELDAALQAQPDEALLGGEPSFGDLPRGPGVKGETPDISVIMAARFARR
jgi:cytochrome b pre-mRNA-processing protein 3